MKIKSETITSRQNPIVALAVSLSEKKYRDRNSLFRTDGVKLAGEVFSHGILPETVLLRQSSAEQVLGHFEHTPDCDAVVLADSVFDKVSDEKSPDGIICIVKHLDNFRKIATIDISDIFFDGDKTEPVVLLESLRDPGNLGTVLRSAAAFGVVRVIMSDDCADIYNPKTLRASMGAVFGLKLVSTAALGGVVGELRACGRRVFAAALDRTAVRLNRLSLKSGDCFVIGNEGHGLSDGVIAACDRSVFIPITDGAESLNAATAASILLWESKRQLEK